MGFLTKITAIFLAIGLFFVSAPAWASIHTYPEANQQTLYRSRQSTPDVMNQAWQVILFKRVQFGQVQTFQLRLVSFPGQVELEHPQPLKVTDSHDSLWQVKDVTLDDPQLVPVQNSVGQYDLLDVMADLTQPQRLDIDISLGQDQTRHLVIPQSMVREWLSLKEISE